MVDSPCPLCDGPSSLAFVKADYPVCDCSRCSHRFTPIGDATGHTAQVYGDDYFAGGGAGYPDYVGDGALLRDRGRRYGRLLANRLAGDGVPPGRLLDVGCAAGFILEGLSEHGFSGVGVEPNHTMAEHGRRRGLDIRDGGLEDLATTEPFQVVSFIQVVAHFVAPQRALEVAAELTTADGYWLLESWNRSSWTARLFGRRWHEYSPPSVLQWYSIDGLVAFAERYGFAEIGRGRPRRWISSSHARSLLEHHLAPAGPLQHLAKLVPRGIQLPYPSEDLFWLLLKRRS